MRTRKSGHIHTFLRADEKQLPVSLPAETADHRDDWLGPDRDGPPSNRTIGGGQLVRDVVRVDDWQVQLKRRLLLRRCDDGD